MQILIRRRLYDVPQPIANDIWSLIRLLGRQGYFHEEQLHELATRLASCHPNIRPDDARYALLRLIESEVDCPLEPCFGGLIALATRTIFSMLTRQSYLVDQEGMVRVETADGEEVCHLSEVARYAFYCVNRRRWYARRDFIRKTNGNPASRPPRWPIYRSCSYLGLRGYHRGNRTSWQPGKRLSLELEVAVGSTSPSFAQAVREVWDEAEEDSSLGQFGAELIVGFVPLQEVETKLTQICGVLERYQCSIPNDHYGFHVSASISGWGMRPAHVNKLREYFYRHDDLVLRVARRLPNEYCAWKDDWENKYRALSLRNDDRLEFRIFKASTELNELRQATLLVEAFLEFCLSPQEDLLKFIGQHYPTLAI